MNVTVYGILFNPINPEYAQFPISVIAFLTTPFQRGLAKTIRFHYLVLTEWSGVDKLFLVFLVETLRE